MDVILIIILDREEKIVSFQVGFLVYDVSVVVQVLVDVEVKSFIKQLKIKRVR